MIKTIKMTLMGTKFVRLEERASCPPPNDPAYHIRILVYNREMPNEFATRSAILAQKPAGLTYELTQMAKQTWRTLRDGPPHARTWQTVKDDYASWRLAREDEPVYEETAPEDLLYPGDEVFPSTTTYPGEVGP
jgi:hypothetical protein